MTKHHPTARRVHRSNVDQDAFLSSVLGGSTWVREHGRTVIIAAALVLVTLFGFLYVRGTRKARENQAAIQLDMVRATVQSGNVQVARQDLQKFVQQFGNTDSGMEAKLMLGQVQLQAGEAQNAISTLQPLARKVDSPLGYNAAMMMGSAYEANKQLPEAERTYLRIADDSRFEFQQREALDRAARLRAESGNTAGAIQLYERIIASFDPDDVQDMSEKSAFEMRLAELRAQVPATQS